MRHLLFLCFVLLLALPVPAQPAVPATPPPGMPPLPSLREQAATLDAIRRERLDVLAPELMRAAGVDMWILVAREYVDDPAMLQMLDARSFTARRRTILVLFDPGGGRPLERLTVSRYGLAGLFQPAWNPEDEPDQWVRLAAIVAARNPQRIAINVSDASPFADGLTASQRDALLAALPEPWRGRVEPAGQLAIDWLSIRTPAEAALYRQVMQTAHAIIAEGLSRAAITPGRTTAADLQWWYRERLSDLGIAPWFHPSVALFREGASSELSGDTLILPGDLVWTDFGLMLMGLATDSQTLAYVLKPGETVAPAGLAAGLAAANRAADLLMASFRTGTTGNELLMTTRRAAVAQGLEASIYSHPIGTHGHGAGPAIGFWDDQAPSPRGEGPVRPMTAWSIELAVTAPVPDWGGQKVPFRLERNVLFDGRRASFIDGRQDRLILIPPAP
jgi:hypothetical protein